MPEFALACCRQLPGNRAAGNRGERGADMRFPRGSSKLAGKIGKGRSCRNNPVPSLAAGKVSLDPRFPCIVDPPLSSASGDEAEALLRAISGSLRVARAYLYRAESFAPHAESRAHAVTLDALRFSLFPRARPWDAFPKERINSPGPAWGWQWPVGAAREGEGIIHAEVERVSPRAPRGGSFLGAVFLFGPIHYLRVYIDMR